jgi:O-acetyl-ADP-ribose deacetylase (regulator of RNase III)
MTVHAVSGDLFVNHVSAAALAHGCNIRGTMRAGIAAEFKRRYPAMVTTYLAACRAGTFNLGDSFYWHDANQPDVFTLAIKVEPRNPASLASLESALRAMRQQAEAESILSIASPRIGAGYGQLHWPDVRATVDAVFAGWPGILYVYEEYIPGQ